MITVSNHGAIQVIHVESQIVDSRIAGAIRQTVAGMVPPHQLFVIEFGKTNLIDSGGLAGLVMLQKFIKNNGCRLNLCHLTKTVMSVFQMTRMDKVFVLADTLDNALNNLNAG